MSRISRRDFLKLSSAVLGGSLLTGLTPRTARQAEARRPNVLMLLLDTLSAPHLSVYGSKRATTPELERFAQRATVYHRHYSEGSYTTPGTASILSGLLPWNHRAVNPGGLVRRDLAANNLFRSVGAEYYRIGYSQNIWADLFLRQFHADLDLHLHPAAFAYPNPLLLGELSRTDSLPYFAFDDFLVGGVKLDTLYPGSVTLGLLDQALGRGRNLDAELARTGGKGLPFNGYFYYQNRAIFDGILETVRAATARNKPYFAYFHLWSPHEPYAPQAEFAELFDDKFKLPQKPQHALIEDGLRAPVLNEFARRYDQYVANVDAEFGRLMDALERSGDLENTVVILLSDHGQLFERGVHGHASRLLYDSGIHVPLIISAPGQRARRDVYTPTGNVDLLPTLSALTGGQPPEKLDGRLLPGFGGEGDEARTLFCMDAKESPAFRPFTSGTFVMMQGARKLIQFTGYAGTPDSFELYDLEADPQELHDLSAADPLNAQRMLEELGATRSDAEWLR